MPHTLLLADDSVTIQRVIELTFADQDVEVVAVSDGEQAIAMLDKSLPDIVLADVAMPGKSGYDVARHVKRTPRLSHIPVILLTGAFQPIDQARATAAGCDGVLSKPFEPQLVIGRVKELLANSRRPIPPSDAAVSLARTGAPSEPGLEHLAPHEPTRMPTPAEIDNYFDQLDAAFARLAGPDAGERQASLEPVQGSNAALPASHGAPSADVLAAPSSTAPGAEPSPEAAQETVEPRLASLAEAFGALLAAEQAATLPVGSPIRSAAHPISGELVEAVVQRVLDRLTDRVVRERAGEIVSAMAERLVREEIERIRSAIT